MYWIEIEFATGKKMMKRYESLNDSFAVYKRYCCGSNPRKKVVCVRAGFNEEVTLECNHVR